jgi:hypothetical protein
VKQGGAADCQPELSNLAGNKKGLQTRVARWHIFKPKIVIWVNLGRTCKGRFWYILWPVGIYTGYLEYFMASWYIYRLFGIFCGHLVFDILWLFVIFSRLVR